MKDGAKRSGSVLLPPGNAKRPNDAVKNDREDANMFISSSETLNLRAVKDELEKHTDAPPHLKAALERVSNARWTPRHHLQQKKSDVAALLKRLEIPTQSWWNKAKSWHAVDAGQFDAQCAVMQDAEEFLHDKLDDRFSVTCSWSSTPTSEECFHTSLQEAASKQTRPFGADFLKISLGKRHMNVRILCYLAQLELPEMRRRAYATDEMPHRMADIVAAVAQRRRERVSTRREISETTLVAALTEHMQKKEPHCDDSHLWFFKPDLEGPQYYFGTLPRS